MDNISPESKGQFSRQFLLRTLFFSALVFAGVTGGVYVGTALSNRPVPFETTPEILDNDSYLKIGQEFPEYILTELGTSNQTSISEITSKGAILLVFVSPSCDMCHHVIPFMNRNVFNRLRPDIGIAMVLDINELSLLNPIPDSLRVPNARYFLTERSSERLEDGINSIPSIVGLTPPRKIMFLMTGYNSRLSADFINKYL